MKEAIKQILKDNSWEMEKDRYVIGLSNLDEIAEEVVKLFLIAPVIKSACDMQHPTEVGKHYVECTLCGRVGIEVK